jgi:hypothetical protein
LAGVVAAGSQPPDHRRILVAKRRRLNRKKNANGQVPNRPSEPDLGVAIANAGSAQLANVEQPWRAPEKYAEAHAPCGEQADHARRFETRIDPRPQYFPTRGTSRK